MRGRVDDTRSIDEYGGGAEMRFPCVVSLFVSGL